MFVEQVHDRKKFLTWWPEIALAGTKENKKQETTTNV